MENFSHIDTWVFDLDNTLYDAEPYGFIEMGNRMTAFVAELLNLPLDEANKVRKYYFQKYGTTLRGLMTEHAVEPDVYLEKVHSFDLAPIAPCGVTRDCLEELPGRKLIFTNAPRGFAARMATHLGIDHCIDGIFGVEDSNYIPKPAPETYDLFCKALQVNPKTSCMFEDMEINLRPAHDIGMTTVWLHRRNEPVAQDHIHHIVEHIPHWYDIIGKKTP